MQLNKYYVNKQLLDPDFKSKFEHIAPSCVYFVHSGDIALNNAKQEQNFDDDLLRNCRTSLLHVRFLYKQLAS